MGLHPKRYAIITMRSVASALLMSCDQFTVWYSCLMSNASVKSFDLTLIHSFTSTANHKSSTWASHVLLFVYVIF